MRITFFKKGRVEMYFKTVNVGLVNRATKPVCHNYWACTLEPASHYYWSPRTTTTETREPRAHAPQQEKPPRWEAGALQRRIAPARRN